MSSYVIATLGLYRIIITNLWYELAPEQTSQHPKNKNTSLNWVAFAPNNQKTCLPNPPARETLSLSFRCSSRLFAHVGGSSPPQKGQNSVYTILYPPQSWLTWMAWPMGRRIHPNTKLVVPYTSVGRVDTQMIHVSWSPPPPPMSGRCPNRQSGTRTSGFCRSSP